MTDLWAEASADHEAEAREQRLAYASAALRDSALPFLLAATTPQDYLHRRYLAADRLQAIASASGISDTEMQDLADQHFGLYYQSVLQKQALPEGVDPLDPVMDASRSSGFGSGPEKPDEHDTGPDFAHGYSEVPMGPLQGPDPAVTVPVYGHPQPLSEATGARKTDCLCGQPLGNNGRCSGCHKKSGKCTCPAGKAAWRRVADSSDYLAETPPDLGTGAGSVDLSVDRDSPSVKAGSRTAMQRHAQDGGDPDFSGGSVSDAGPESMGAGPNMPAGTGGGMTSPDGMNGSSGGGSMPMPGSPPAPPTSQIQSGASLRDPVALRIEAVASVIKTSNPHLGDDECRRVARRVVGGYLRQGAPDYTDSVVNDAPMPSGGSGGGLKGIMDMLPKPGGLPGGGGGSGGDDAGDAAGEAGDVADVAELAAL
jgi:hypothetical protein